MTKFLMYQIYLYAMGNIENAIKHLFMAKYLSADAVFIGPIQASPGFDHGYDVSDYRAINPQFGTMDDFDRFVDMAHGLGIKVVIDLVINHTSTEHKWFSEHPEYYCWSEEDRPGWHNLFDQGPAWCYDEQMGEYYLHLFHRSQADLDWFVGENVNNCLVHEFQSIANFWTDEHGVDGFRLDMPQAINKNLKYEKLEFSDLLFGDRAERVISAIFAEAQPLLVMECFDPTFGSLTRHYVENTPVDFVMNAILKDAIEDGEFKFADIIKSSVKNPHFMLDFESHDSPRFPSRPAMTPEEGIWRLFNSGANAICLYQGQELGLYNPTKEQLPDELMLELDAQTAMRHQKGANLDELRSRSRANARIPVPLEEYRKQLAVPGSYLSLTKTWIDHWRKI